MKNEAKTIVAVMFTFFLVSPTFFGTLLLAFWGVSSLVWMLAAGTASVAIVWLSWVLLGDMKGSGTIASMDVVLGVVAFLFFAIATVNPAYAAGFYITCLIEVVIHSTLSLLKGLGIMSVQDQQVETEASAKA